MHAPDDQTWRRRASEPIRNGDLPAMAEKIRKARPNTRHESRAGAYKTAAIGRSGDTTQACSRPQDKAERPVRGCDTWKSTTRLRARARQAAASRASRARAHRSRNATRGAMRPSKYIAIAPTARTVAISNPSSRSAGFIGAPVPVREIRETAAASTRFAIATTASRRRRRASSRCGQAARGRILRRSRVAEVRAGYSCRAWIAGIEKNTKMTMNQMARKLAAERARRGRRAVGQDVVGAHRGPSERDEKNPRPRSADHDWDEEPRAPSVLARGDVALEMFVDEEEAHEAGISRLHQDEPRHDDRGVDERGTRRAASARFGAGVVHSPAMPAGSRRRAASATGPLARVPSASIAAEISIHRRADGCENESVTRGEIKRGQRRGQEKCERGIERRKSREAEKQRTERQRKRGEKSRRRAEHRLGQRGGD